MIMYQSNLLKMFLKPVLVNMAKRQKMSTLQLEDLPDEMIVKVKFFIEPEMLL